MLRVMRFAVAWLALVLSATAAAQPTVRVRSETRIELRTERHEDHVVIEGALRDDLGEPLAGRELVLRATPDDGTEVPARHTLTTRSDGGFRVRLDLIRGGHRLRGSFGGDPTHERVEVERRLDLDRADVRLRVSVPEGGRIDLDRTEHRIEVVAESVEGGDGLSIDLIDELDRPLAWSQTDQAGRLAIVIPSEMLGPPGAGRIKARSRPDTRRAEAQTEVPIVRYRATVLELSASRSEARPGDDVRLTGTLSDATGPIEGRAVGLFAQEGIGGGPAGTADEHLATVLTDRDGRFVTDVGVDARHEGTLEVVARYESDAPGRASSVSPPVWIAVAAARPTPWPWLLVPLAICALLLALIARGAPKRPERSVEAPPERPIGVDAARRRTLRADRHDLSGYVLDHRDDEPIANARVALVDEAGRELVARTDARGGFALAEVAVGAFTLSVDAAGYVEVSTRVTIPHRGEWTAATVRLESRRARALARYRPVAAELLPSPRLWGIWTQRDILERARGTGRAGPSLADLTDRVERAYYGPVPPSEADVVAIEERAGETLRALEAQPAVAGAVAAEEEAEGPR